MTDDRQEIVVMLDRKREIDAMGGGGLGFAGGEGQFVQRQRWMVDAIDLLLRVELGRRHGPGS